MPAGAERGDIGAGIGDSADQTGDAPAPATADPTAAFKADPSTTQSRSVERDLRRMSRGELVEVICTMRQDALTSGASEVPTPSAPATEAVEAEAARLEHRRRYRRTLLTTGAALVVVAAAAVLVATLLLPVLQVSGTSMEPTLEDGDVVVLASTGSFGTGDLVGFYYQNKLLLKRVIGGPGDVVDVNEAGDVTVNGKAIDEAYVTGKSIGECDVELPCQVPESRYFVMGDNRTTSIDSRTSAIGCIERDQFVGKVLLRVWPLGRLSALG